MIKLPWVARKEKLVAETEVEIANAARSHAAADAEISKLRALAPGINLRAKLLEWRNGDNHYAELFDGPLKGY